MSTKLHIKAKLSDEVEARLGILTEAAQLLQLDRLTFLSFASSIMRLSYTSLELKTTLNRLRHAEQELENLMASAKYQEQLITRWLKEFEHTSTSESLLSLEKRKATALNRKAKEYENDLHAALADQEATSVTVATILEQRERLRLKHKQVKTKRAKVKAFHGLPPNIDLARIELQIAKRDQMDLIQLRQRLLDKMAGSIT